MTIRKLGLVAFLSTLLAACAGSDSSANSFGGGSEESGGSSNGGSSSGGSSNTGTNSGGNQNSAGSSGSFASGGSGGEAWGGGGGAGGGWAGGAGSAGTGGAGNAGTAGTNSQAGTAGTAGTGATSLCDMLDSSGPRTLYLSADDSNSMASPVLARQIIQNGGKPWPGSIRTYEFLNYYNVVYQPADAGTLRLVPQMRPGAEPGQYELQIGVQAPPIQRRPLNLTFALDASGSMEGTGINLEKAVLKAVAQHVQEGDIVSILTWSDTQNVLLSGHVVTAPNDPQIISVANSLTTDGSTNLDAGLQKAYELAQANFSPNRINRVILVSDGGANVGQTNADFIALKADDNNQEGIYMVGVGAGESYSEGLMNTVTDAGNGAYVYLDSAEEATKMFHLRFDEVMDVAARNVQVSMTVPWYFMLERFYGEQVSTDPTKVKPQHLAPADAMVFSQVLKACDVNQVVNTDAVKVAAKWTEPLTYQQKEISVDTTVDGLIAAAGPEIRRGHAIVMYAEALKAGFNLSGQQFTDAVDQAIAAVDEADPNGEDESLSEIKGLLQQYRATSPLSCTPRAPSLFFR